jgi:hypothetical protein
MTAGSKLTFKAIVALLNSNIVTRNAKLSRAVCQWNEDDEATSVLYFGRIGTCRLWHDAFAFVLLGPKFDRGLMMRVNIEEILRLFTHRDVGHPVQYWATHWRLKIHCSELCLCVGFRDKK